MNNFLFGIGNIQQRPGLGRPLTQPDIQCQNNICLFNGRNDVRSHPHPRIADIDGAVIINNIMIAKSSRYREILAFSKALQGFFAGIIPAAATCQNKRFFSSRQHLHSLRQGICINPGFGNGYWMTGLGICDLG